MLHCRSLREHALWAVFICYRGAISDMSGRGPSQCTVRDGALRMRKSHGGMQ